MRIIFLGAIALSIFSACASPSSTPASLPNSTAISAPTLIATLAAPAPTVTSARANIFPGLFSSPCATSTPLSVSPIALENITNITPLGNLNPPAHTFPTSHMYFNLPTRQGAPGEGPMGDGRVVPQFPIVSPGKIILKSVFVSDLTSTRSGKPVSYTEYKPTFAVCGGIQIEFGHTGPLSDRINAAIKTAPPRNCQEYSTGPDTVRGCNYELNLQLDAGEPIGFNSGRAFGFDFGAYDSSAPQQKFAQPERYGFEGRYNVCPLDLFEPNARAKFYSYLGQLVSQTKIQLRTSEPLCGTPMQDVAGTAQGNWFVNPKEPNPEDNNLALVYDNIDPTKPVLSVGVSVKGLASNTYSFTRKSSGAINREFSAIKPDGQIYCFEQLVKGQFASQPVDAITILVALTNAETLRLEARQASPCNASALTFSANAATFYR